MRLRWLRDQRGSILLFTTILVAPLMIIFGGLAMDLAYHGTVDDELQRSMDAAALAGAGKLGFNSSVFPTVRSFAQSYASLNPYKVGTINLNLNTGNDPSGNIVLGIWNQTAGTFTPSLDGTQVNAVQCRYSTTVPTSFLKLIGVNTLAAGAQAIAVSDPPATIPPTEPPFPIGLSGCSFQTPNGFTSQGCGQPVTFISSSGKSTGPPPGTNTAAWVNLAGTGTPSANATSQAVTDAFNGVPGPAPLAGTQIGANNGMQQSVFDTLTTDFVQKFNASQSSPFTITNTDANGNTSTTYTGPGWDVFVPVIGTACPPKAINGTLTILGWTRFVMTQVINHGDCVVKNTADTNSLAFCPPPNGTASKSPALRSVFGYFSCQLFQSPPVPVPAPRASLATRLRLVR